MLWRKKNSYRELVEIVKMMKFNDRLEVRNYSGVFHGKTYPVIKPSLEQKLKDIDKQIKDNEWTDEYADQMATHYLSQWVYSNVSYNHEAGNWRTQFDKMRDAYYYYKRMETAGFLE
jgi:hypothetical protein